MDMMELRVTYNKESCKWVIWESLTCTSKEFKDTIDLADWVDDSLQAALVEVS